ncbi:MAG: ABC transporter permease [Betaproteobacteria bacterium]|nr:ABC transporter permease [Betaproteobacteria bacterium]
MALWRRLAGFATTVALIVAWEIVAEYVYPHYVSTSRNIFPPPSAILVTAWDLTRSGELLRHSAFSLGRVFVGFGLACAVGIPLGLTMGAWPFWRRQVSVVVEVLRPIPPFAWIPLGLLWFGVGDTQSVFVIFIASVFPVILNTVFGIDAVDPVLRRSAMSLGADKWRLFTKVILPAALPQIVVGMRIGLSFAWMVLVASELIGSTSGLGFLILDSRNLGLPSLAFMGMLVIGLIGFLLDSAIRAVERFLLPWRA